MTILSSHTTTDEPAESPICVVGGGRLGLAIAGQLADRDRRVTLLVTAALSDPPPDVRIERTDTLDATALDRLDAGRTVVIGDTDSESLLLAQLLRTRGDTEDLVACIQDPETAVAFDAIGVETIQISSVLAGEITTHL